VVVKYSYAKPNNKPINSENAQIQSTFIVQRVALFAMQHFSRQVFTYIIV